MDSGDSGTLSSVQDKMEATQEECIVLQTQPLSQPPPNEPRREKRHRSSVDSTVLSMLVAAYAQHFAEYSKEKINVTQLVPGKVWKAVYKEYSVKYPNSTLQEETLKEKLREVLKKSKTGISNVGADKAVLQPEEVLAQLKSTDSHAMRNILQLRGGQIDDASKSDSTTLDPQQLSTPLTIPSPIQSRASPSVEKQLTEGELLALQAKSIQAIAKSFQARAETKEALVALKLEITEEKRKKVKIDNLQVARELGVLSEEDFKAKVKEVLRL